MVFLSGTPRKPQLTTMDCCPFTANFPKMTLSTCFNRMCLRCCYFVVNQCHLVRSNYPRLRKPDERQSRMEAMEAVTHEALEQQLIALNAHATEIRQILSG